MSFEGFRPVDVEIGDGVRIHARVGGEGPPLLLLHGYPQTHLMWRKVAPDLARRFTVVASDLRGYGASSKPPSEPEAANQSKRAMAADQAALMRALGHERFHLAGHDRGGRVAHRLTLDHPQAVARWATLDIAPTREMYRGTDRAFAHAYWHWFFLTLPAPLPETMIGADPDLFWTTKCGALGGGLEPFADVLDDYLAAFRDPEAIRASCDDYRAAAGIDIAHDDADGGRKAERPLLALWGAKGVVERCFDPLALWRERVGEVEGRALPTGHYIPEERPDLVAEALIEWFSRG